jgi:hypothetical protein
VSQGELDQWEFVWDLVPDAEYQRAVVGLRAGLQPQFVSRGGERRALRAEVRRELSSIEGLRWAKPYRYEEPEEFDHEALLAACRRFVAAALCVPQTLIPFPP